jgi:hypothetical protein
MRAANGCSRGGPGCVAHADSRSVLAFNVLASVGYAGTAFARTGPPEQDRAVLRYPLASTSRGSAR